MSESYGSRPEQGGAPEYPGLLPRVVHTFLSPGRVGDALAQRPAWAGAAVLGSLLVAGAFLAIPSEVWEASARAEILSRGGQLPEAGAELGGLTRIFSAVAAGVAWFVVIGIQAGIYFTIFAFVLGDVASYRNYFAAVSHASLVSAVGAVIVTPLRIAREDPGLTLSLGTFLEPLLEPGPILTFTGGLDLFALWSWVVLAVMVSHMTRGRSLGSALAVIAVTGFVVVGGITLLRMAVGA